MWKNLLKYSKKKILPTHEERMESDVIWGLKCAVKELTRSDIGFGDFYCIERDQTLYYRIFDFEDYTYVIFVDFTDKDVKEERKSLREFGPWVGPYIYRWSKNSEIHHCTVFSIHEYVEINNKLCYLFTLNLGDIAKSIREKLV